MNPELLLNQVELAIKNRPESPTDWWALVYQDEKITCVPRDALPRNGITLITFSRNCAVNGFSTHEWNLIKKHLQYCL